MKNLILALAVLVSAQNTFAASARVTDSCVAKTITGQEIRLQHFGYAGEGHYMQNEDGATAEVEFKGSRFGGAVENAAVILKQAKEVYMTSKKTDDGEYETYQATSTRVAVVEKVKNAVASEYGIKKGTALVFVCYTSLVAPQ